MSDDSSGCGCLGCLGIIVIIVLIVLIYQFVMWVLAQNPYTVTMVFLCLPATALLVFLIRNSIILAKHRRIVKRCERIVSGVENGRLAYESIHQPYRKNLARDAEDCEIVKGYAIGEMDKDYLGKSLDIYSSYVKSVSNGITARACLIEADPDKERAIENEITRCENNLVDYSGTEVHERSYFSIVDSYHTIWDKYSEKNMSWTELEKYIRIAGEAQFRIGTFEKTYRQRLQSDLSVIANHADDIKLRKTPGVIFLSIVAIVMAVGFVVLNDKRQDWNAERHRVVEMQREEMDIKARIEAERNAALLRNENIIKLTESVKKYIEYEITNEEKSLTDHTVVYHGLYSDRKYEKSIKDVKIIKDSLSQCKKSKENCCHSQDVEYLNLVDEYKRSIIVLLLMSYEDFQVNEFEQIDEKLYELLDKGHHGGSVRYTKIYLKIFEKSLQPAGRRRLYYMWYLTNMINGLKDMYPALKSLSGSDLSWEMYEEMASVYMSIVNTKFEKMPAISCEDEDVDKVYGVQDGDKDRVEIRLL